MKPRCPVLGWNLRLHLDVTRRQAGVWGIEPLEGLAERWPSLWPGWQLELWGSDYQQQIDACNGALSLPPIDLSAMLGAVAERVEYWPVAERLRSEGVNPKHLRGMYQPQLDVGVTIAQLTAIRTTIAAPVR